ncbi:MAG: ABC transporter substrate-binding protein [Firmicutes bacterium]|nr:ABC transporter substrate-binding protein [Bacillota bacterium]MCL5039342.1 ABC transporter substrate-binding protein [Bacillota bacterium]
MFLRQWRSLWVLILVLFVVLAGCASNTAQPTPQPKQEAKAVTPVEIEFWNYWDGNNGKVISALVEQFNQSHPNIKVKNVFLPWGELLSKLQASIAGKNPPAVAAGDLAWMAKLNRSGALIDLTDAAKKANLDLGDFYPALLEYDRYQGKLQGLPISTNNLALFYNKDLFKKAGLDPEKPPKTWDELRAYAKKITALGGGIKGFEIYTVAGDSGEGVTWQFQPYLWQAGGEYLADNYTKPGFNNAAGEKALKFLVDLIRVDKVAEAGKWGAFDKGQAGMRIDGSWMVGIWAGQTPFDFGTAMIPIPEGGTRATNMGGEHIFVFQTTPEKQAAATEFALWFASTPVQVDWDMRTGFMPVRESVSNDAKYREWLKKEPRLLPFVEQQQYAHARPPIPEYPDTSLAFAKELEKAFYGKVTVKEALANAEKAVTAALKK